MFKKKKNLFAPLTGRVIDISECEDEVFSQKILGDGIAIVPSSGDVFSPCDGEIVQMVETKHAIGIKSTGGVEILIHLGMDTVSLGGEGFEYFVSEGEKVKEGQKIMKMDLDFVSSKGLKTVTPVVVTNIDEIKNLEKSFGEAESGKTVVMTYK